MTDAIPVRPIAEAIEAGASMSELLASYEASAVFTALVCLELSEHSTMPVGHRVTRVYYSDQVDRAVAATMA